MDKEPATSMSEAERIACWVNKVAREMSAATTKAVGEHDLSGTQSKLLLRLQLGMDSPSEIARCVGIDASNMSRLIRALEARGLVVRAVDEENRSRAVLTLTKAGEATAREIRPLTKRVEEEVIGSLNAKSRKTLIDSLRKLSETLNSQP